nr:hypothetical protein [Tanacetum cinerariifolium]
MELVQDMSRCGDNKKGEAHCWFICWMVAAMEPTTIQGAMLKAGMDWLSDHKAEIVYHDKVVRIPLLDGKVLRVLEERPKEKARQYRSVKVKEHKLGEIVVVKDFPKVFSDDLSRLPPIREIEFRIELIPGAILVAKSPYLLAPSEMEDCLDNSKNSRKRVSFDQACRLGEHQYYLLRRKMVQFLGHVINGDDIHVDSSKMEAVRNWEAPGTPNEVRSFLGLTGYYRRFIKNFSKIAKSLTILTQKNKTFDWGEEQENAFQYLKDKLCVGLGCVLMQRGKVIAFASRQLRIHEKNYTTYDLELGAVKELNMQQHRWIELFSDYDCEIRILSSVKDKILAAQGEASDEITRMQQGLDEMMEHRPDGTLYYLDRVWITLKGDVRTLIMDKAHKSKYSVHPRADKMYYDLTDRYWWPGIKKDIVVVDRLSKSAYFLPMREDFKMDRLARLYLDEIVARYGVPVSIISDRDGHFTSRFWQSMQESLRTWLDMSTAYHPQTDGQTECTIQTLEDMLKACVLDFGGSWDVHLPLVEFLYKNSYHYSIRCASFEALYGRKCCSSNLWAEKSYADKRRKPLEFKEGDHVMLKVAPWKGVVCFGKKRKLTPMFVGPFEITKRISKVAYRLRLPQELNNVHDTFHVSNLKKCLANPTLRVPLEEILVDEKLNFMKEPVEILERI